MISIAAARLEGALKEAPDRQHAAAEQDLIALLDLMRDAGPPPSDGDPPPTAGTLAP